MATVRARNPLRWVRRLLLLLVVLAVGALAVMLGAYRFGQAPEEVVPSPRGEVATADADVLNQGEDFDFTQTSDGRPVFRIRADKSRRDKQQNVFLTTVILDIFRETGETYTVTSDTARVNESTWAARLEGDVVMQGWDDLSVEARAIELLDGGQMLRSVGEVRFRYPPSLGGRASQLAIDRRTDTFSLTGGVHLHSLPGAETPLKLDCQRLLYQRAEGIVRAIDDVLLSTAEQELTSRYATIFLRPDGSVRTVHARWDVRGTARSINDAGLTTAVHYFGRYLEVVPAAESATDAETADVLRLEGWPRRPARVTVVDSTGLARSLRGKLIESQSRDGQPIYIEGFGDPLEMSEYLDLAEPYPLREGCARRMFVGFLADGSLGHVRLENQVQLRTPEMHLSGGNQAFVNAETNEVEIRGPLVELYSERGDLRAPRIRYAHNQGLVRADEGVEAELASSAVAGLHRTPFGQGSGPIRIDAQEASLLTDPASFTFSGEVRAWRDRSLLLADQLRGQQESEELSASGTVKTVWSPDPERVAGGDQRMPIEVEAEHLAYRESGNVLVYSGDVKVRQGRRVLSCQELAVDLAANGSRAERMTCQDDVRLVDSEGGRRVLGDTAIYQVAAQEVEIFGDQVRMVDADKNKLVGRYLHFDLASNNVQMKSRRPTEGGADSR